MADEKLSYPKVINYDNIRHTLRVGDIILFAGAYVESRMIRFFSGGKASHVGIVLKTEYDEAIGRHMVEILEANHDTAYPDLNGVILTHLSDRLPFYKGDIWLLPLNEEFRKLLDMDAFDRFLRGEMGKEYDMATRWKSAIDFLDKFGLSHNEENLQQYFCSELVAAAFKVAGGLPHINPSEVSPADVYQWDIYTDEFYQIKCFDYVAKPLSNYKGIKLMQIARSS
ncbi:MAG: hypothetical protein ACPGJS_05625 [Flammeovirgaceae bacterium]